MTVLILAQRKFFSIINVGDLYARAEEYFVAINRGGVLSLFFVGLAAAGIIAYLSALVMTFDLGVRLQDASSQRVGQSEGLRRLEVLERQREARFTTLHREALAGMDKISKVKYLTPEGPAVSRASSGIPQ